MKKTIYTYRDDFEPIEGCYIDLNKYTLEELNMLDVYFSQVTEEVEDGFMWAIDEGKNLFGYIRKENTRPMLSFELKFDDIFDIEEVTIH